MEKIALASYYLVGTLTAQIRISRVLRNQKFAGRIYNFLLRNRGKALLYFHDYFTTASNTIGGGGGEGVEITTVHQQQVTDWLFSRRETKRFPWQIAVHSKLFKAKS